MSKEDIVKNKSDAVAKEIKALDDNELAGISGGSDILDDEKIQKMRDEGWCPMASNARK